MILREQSAKKAVCKETISALLLASILKTSLLSTGGGNGKQRRSSFGKGSAGPAFLSPTPPTPRIEIQMAEKSLLSAGSIKPFLEAKSV